MRTRLSRLITDAAKNDPNVIVLSSDHGYALFDEIRQECPDQFVNCGIIEQAMIGIAAGLAQIGYRPIVYGLASFVPMRCLEQIKLDICYSNLPVIIIGDGAGLVYSTLGASHHCAEDLACLRPMPNLEICLPHDARSLEGLFKKKIDGPRYIRIGRTDLGDPGEEVDNNSSVCLFGSGSMTKKANDLAKKLDIDSRFKSTNGSMYFEFRHKKIIVIEEHSEKGGVFSALAEAIVQLENYRPLVIPICLKNRFADKCGSWQYALSEHEMDDASLEKRVKEILMENA